MKITSRIVLVTVLGIWACVLSQTATAVNTPAAQSQSFASFYGQYPYLRVIEGSEPTDLSDEEFLDVAGRVVFPVGRAELPDDAPLLRQLAEEVIPQLNNDTLQVVRILFRGAASPDGPTALNQRLGEQRVRSLFAFFKTHLSTPVSEQLFSTAVDIEDYRTLCLLMRRGNDPDYQQVQALCDRYLADGSYSSASITQLKRELQAVKDGTLWQRLKVMYFPQLRTARIVLFVQKVQRLSLDTIAAGPLVPEPSVTLADTLQPVEPVLPVEPEPVSTVTEAMTADTLSRRELLAVKTNLLFYAVYMPGYNRWCPMPNVGVEYYPRRGHFTFGASLDFPWWQNYNAHKYFQVRNYQLETRYYLRAASAATSPAYSGFYLQAYVHGGLFGICFDADRGWEGEGMGAGVGLGYVMPVAKNGHWRLDFGAQFGYFRAKYDPYQFENPVDPNYTDQLYYYKWTLKPDLFKCRQYRFNWFGPTRLGITLSYDLLYRKRQKGQAYTQQPLPQTLPVREGSSNINSQR